MAPEQSLAAAGHGAVWAPLTDFLSKPLSHP